MRCVKISGFEERIKGDHHIFSKKGIVEIINIQPKKDKAKPYQVKEMLGVVREVLEGESKLESH